MELHEATKREYKAIKTLYMSAFPRNERAPFFLIKRRALQNRASMLVAQKNGEQIGFAYTIVYKHLVYLFYFAVAEDKRGCGNGSQMLRLLSAYYADKTIFLAREPLDDTAENSQQRINRHSFYKRNGYVDLPFRVREVNVLFDIMSTSKDISASDYDALIRAWAGELVLRFIKMEFMEADKS